MTWRRLTVAIKTTTTITIPAAALNCQTRFSNLVKWSLDNPRNLGSITTAVAKRAKGTQYSTNLRATMFRPKNPKEQIIKKNAGPDWVFFLNRRKKIAKAVSQTTRIKR